MLDTHQNTIISDNYLKLQTELHKDELYGIASLSFAPIIKNIIIDNSFNSISDYGAGKKNLEKALLSYNSLNLQYHPYDPVFPEYGEPKSADLVCCIDVLEHIEPEFIDNTILKLSKITNNAGFFTIHQGPAGKILQDGRNAHLIQKPTSWWLLKLCNYFEIHKLDTHNIHGPGFWVFVSPKIKIN